MYRKGTVRQGILSSVFNVKSDMRKGKEHYSVTSVKG